ncbi:regulatory protein, tetR family [Saccharopolyspora antimicrobica]|uniref:Regulatory protein, tetR family n=1 Tax=Saccharopolyspora antimicrobica TaxID=455193 RepID=A0A1I5GRC6_9PSEU|nr:TetR family transcriptional regulator [Saccharopolyspora antimicrobica]SFO38101.1 regulatory protein, tetR family [Saccharopolyspora antimicrobica]
MQILRTAERLFATQGIDATSLRQISADAEQRNTAAAKYHFQNKPTLIRAIFDYRLDGIDTRRAQLLKLAEDEGRLDEPWHLVEVLVRPLAEQAAEPGSHYVRFLDRVCEHVGRDVTALPEIAGLDEAVAVGRLVTDRLPFLSQPQVRPRIRWAGQLILTALADLEQRNASADPRSDEPDTETFVVALIDAVTGLLTAAASAPRE